MQEPGDGSIYARIYAGAMKRASYPSISDDINHCCRDKYHRLCLLSSFITNHHSTNRFLQSESAISSTLSSDGVDRAFIHAPFPLNRFSFQLPILITCDIWDPPGRWPEATQVVVNGEFYGKLSTTEDTVKRVVILSDTAEGRGNV